ncbi:hypothetical protein HWV62_44671 [Athelia sp. TMB]|nr:hypothetical protein HWV62_44671 [Athelia sp. TMB]
MTLKSLVKHFLIKSTSSYSTIGSLVGTYIQDHHEKLRLGLYVTDHTVRTAINTCMNMIVHDSKSNLRKAIWQSLAGDKTNKKKTVDLDVFARHMVKDYHVPKIPDVVPDSMLANLALMRNIGHSLIAKEDEAQRVEVVGRRRGSDTGFWTILEKRLDELYEKHGEDHKSEGWREWEKEVISEDKTMHARMTRTTALS